MRALTLIALLSFAMPLAAEELPARPLTVEVALIDTAAVGMGLLTAAVQPVETSTLSRVGRGFAMAGGVGAIGAPSVYWANRRLALGMASLSLRTVAPLATATFGFVAHCLAVELRTGCVTEGIVGGTAVGIVAASVLDIAILSRLTRPQRVQTTRWYGWQTLIIDGAAVALGTALALSIDDPLFLRDPESGLVNFALAEWLPMWLIGSLGAPIVHFAHGELAKGLGSGALRFLGGVVVAVGGIVGYCAAVGGERGCSSVGFSWGLVGGAAAVALFDAFVIARERVEAPPDAPPAVWLLPTVLGEAPGLALGGRF